MMELFRDIVILLFGCAAICVTVVAGYFVINIVIWLLPLLITAGVLLTVISIIYRTFNKSS